MIKKAFKGFILATLKSYPELKDLKKHLMVSDGIPESGALEFKIGKQILRIRKDEKGVQSCEWKGILYYVQVPGKRYFVEENEPWIEFSEGKKCRVTELLLHPDVEILIEKQIPMNCFFSLENKFGKEFHITKIERPKGKTISLKLFGTIIPDELWKNFQYGMTDGDIFVAAFSIPDAEKYLDQFLYVKVSKTGAMSPQIFLMGKLWEKENLNAILFPDPLRQKSPLEADYKGKEALEFSYTEAKGVMTRGFKLDSLFERQLKFASQKVLCKEPQILQELMSHHSVVVSEFETARKAVEKNFPYLVELMDFLSMDSPAENPRFLLDGKVIAFQKINERVEFVWDGIQRVISDPKNIKRIFVQENIPMVEFEKKRPKGKQIMPLEGFQFAHFIWKSISDFQQEIFPGKGKYTMRIPIVSQEEASKNGMDGKARIKFPFVKKESALDKYLDSCFVETLTATFVAKFRLHLFEKKILNINMFIRVIGTDVSVFFLGHCWSPDEEGDKVESINVSHKGISIKVRKENGGKLETVLLSPEENQNDFARAICKKARKYQENKKGIDIQAMAKQLEEKFKCTVTVACCEWE